MYRKIEPVLRMTRHEASERFSDSYIFMQMKSTRPSDSVGTVHYVGDKPEELYGFIRTPGWNYCGVVDGADLWENSLGGVVVHE